MRKDGTYDKMAKKYFDFNVYGDSRLLQARTQWGGPAARFVSMPQKGASKRAVDHFSAKAASFLAKKCIVKRF